MSGIPFEGWLRLAVLRFGLAPADFWRLSLKEWAWLAAPDSPPALSRSDLDRLLSLHPDISHDT
ncbi:phage tail assembly chaperone [Hyphobacterium sp.]|uniref:phage tail assembly chaperone n=1 Tax=Hyphobacterium sp. TaxID=2004662 RepID=UPI003BAC70A8